MWFYGLYYIDLKGQVTHTQNYLSQLLSPFSSCGDTRIKGRFPPAFCGLPADEGWFLVHVNDYKYLLQYTRPCACSKGHIRLLRIDTSLPQALS